MPSKYFLLQVVREETSVMRKLHLLDDEFALLAMVLFQWMCHTAVTKGAVTTEFLAPLLQQPLKTPRLMRSRYVTLLCHNKNSKIVGEK